MAKISKEKRTSRILEMLNYYSDTFARLPFIKLKDLGGTSVSLLCSIINYRSAYILIYNRTDDLEILSCKEGDTINICDFDEVFLKHLHNHVDSSKLLEFNKLLNQLFVWV
jgi:hypothetical protein